MPSCRVNPLSLRRHANRTGETVDGLKATASSHHATGDLPG
jgi:hypothetical protein